MTRDGIGQHEIEVGRSSRTGYRGVKLIFLYNNIFMNMKSFFSKTTTVCLLLFVLIVLVVFFGIRSKNQTTQSVQKPASGSTNQENKLPEPEKKEEDPV